MENKKKERIGFVVFCLIVILIIFCEFVPSKIRQKRVQEELRYLSEETEETGRSIDELSQKSKEAKEKLLRDLENFE